MHQTSKTKSNTFIKIKTFKYMSSSPSCGTKSRGENNPIRIVVDKIGLDGQYHRQIVNQSQEQQKQILKYSSSKMQKSKVKKYEQNINNYYSHNSHKNKDAMIRSEMFNRFQYDNYEKIPMKSNRKHFIISPNKINYHSQKNIEIVFCQSKFPQFVNKTNHKIQEIFKKEQDLLHQQNQQYLFSTMQNVSSFKNHRKSTKTTLANCLKEFGTLEKLSNFMQNDRNLRQNCLSYGLQKDPSKTLLLDVLTHRFTFMKQLSKRLRENIYKILLGRADINILTKINIQQYMRFYEMFINRDCKIIETATFMYLLLFGNSLPTIQLAKSIVQQTNGPLHKQRLVLEDIKQILQLNPTQIVPILAKNERLLHTFIDLLVQK